MHLNTITNFYRKISPGIILLALLMDGCAKAVLPTASTPARIAPQPAIATELGKTKSSTKDGMDLVYVPAGRFLMGTTVGLTDEQPIHQVDLDAYWLDKTEITNSMYAQCVRAGVCQEPSVLTYYVDPSYADHPVESVSWNDSVSYCSWAGRRLPTEAEWEKAATWDPQSATQRVYPWGNDYDCSKGNFDDETELDASLMQDGSKDCDGYVRSAPVGSYPAGASVYGVLDLGGNVWEWVHDTFIEVDPFNASIKNYYAISPSKNPQGVDPAMSDYRVVRGGSYNFTFGYGRSAYRLWFGLDDKYEGIGFRCAASE